MWYGRDVSGELEENHSKCKSIVLTKVSEYYPQYRTIECKTVQWRKDHDQILLGVPILFQLRNYTNAKNSNNPKFGNPLFQNVPLTVLIPSLGLFGKTWVHIPQHTRISPTIFPE
ncbi:hypothetical protein CEXT_214741 [Caerostris extrusa]|uniref:Uncharacterized protein n=1 Tax=Caerostris extrusa TaxID=172846 RepID=A0AAV4W8Q7_CAEEX|nr:hypothetical protein CEXT_214741 [Caerostris extrusa]